MLTNGLETPTTLVSEKDFDPVCERLKSAEQLSIVGNNTIPDNDNSISSVGTAQETSRNPSDLRTAREMTGIVDGCSPETYLNLLKRKNIK
jgi:hypothetical protein